MVYFFKDVSAGGGLFYLAKTVVSVLYKDEEHKVEKDMKLENKYSSGSSRELTPSGREKGVSLEPSLLRECKNTESVWELRRTGFCEGGRK